MTTESALRALLGGALIGLAAAISLIANGRLAGISGTLGRALDVDDDAGRPYRLAFLVGLIATGMTVTIVTVMALGVAQLVDMPFGQIWLGLSPGALEGMGALGIALGYDTAFIAAHHVIRLLMLSFAIPAVVMLIRWQERRGRALPQSGGMTGREGDPR